MSSHDHVARSLDEVAHAPSVVTIGVFDGVHRGHQTIIGRAVSAAEETNLRSVAVTFDRHPAEIIDPGSQPRYLQRLERKVSCLLDERVDLVLVLPFSHELSQHPPDRFVERVLAGDVAARRVVVGTNFRFGHDAAGDVVSLSELGEVHGFETEAVTLLHLDDVPISSTKIRERLADGDVAWAAEALGRAHVVEGPVVRGEGRGRQIGVPTANVHVPEQFVVPAGGVYAGWAGIDGERHRCVVNIGTRPTFEGTRRTVEAHLLDVEPDLYDRDLAVGFVERLRDERRFDGPEQLVEQIERDIAAADALLADRPDQDTSTSSR